MFRKVLFGSVLILFSVLAYLFQTTNHLSTRTTSEAVINSVTEARISDSYGKLPLSFEANQGQTDSQVKFLSRGNGYGLFLTSNEAVLALRREAEGGGRRTEGRRTEIDPSASRLLPPAVLRMQLVGANTRPKVSGLDELPGKSNYFIGNDPEKWRTNVPNYAKVKYQDIYPGVDMIYYGNQRQLEYDLVVSPGASPKAITLSFSGTDKLEIDAEGNLVLHSTGGQIYQHKPTVYQETNGIRQEISGSYVLKGETEIGFEVAAYDAGKPLIIDPVLSYSTYLGGTNYDQGLGIAVDSSGNIYVAGLTASTDFPTASPLQASNGGSQDAFVTKLNSSGSALIYSTYLGGSGSENGVGISVDPAGNVYIAGFTNSTDFPTTSGAFQTANGGSLDAFVTKLSPDGSVLVYSTYLGGSGSDFTFRGIAVDSSGNVYVAGGTTSTNFPTANPLQAANAGSADVFVTKLNAAGSTLVYSTYLGGSGFDALNNLKIAIDAGGNAYVAGDTTSTDFPTTPGAFQTAFGGGPSDAFVTKLNAAGSALVYSTYLGGSFQESCNGIAVDSAGNAYVSGVVSSTNFPTKNPLQASFGGGPADAFVTKLNAAGSALVYSTYLGGSDLEIGTSIAIDSTGNAYVTGLTASTNFPTASPFQAANAGGQDVYVAKLNPAGSMLVYSTYLGGSGDDNGQGIVVDSSGNAYVTGITSSGDFPTMNPFQPSYAGGGSDAFVAKITDVVQVTIDIKPGSFPNSINPRSNGVIPVAILTTSTFDATTVDPTTVKFGATGTEAAPVHAALEDVDKDGDLDLVLQFRTQETGIVCGTTSASLTGKTMSGQSVKGSDSVNTVGCK